MKNHLSNRAVLPLIIVTLLLGCQGKQGDPGPTGKTGANGTNGTNGTNGATGPQGPQGPAGTNPAASFINGYFKGVVSGTLQNKTTFTDSINFQYAAGYEYFVTSGSTTTLRLFRSQFPVPQGTQGQTAEGNSSLTLGMNIVNFGASNQTITYNAGTLLFFSVLSGDQLLTISSSSPDSFSITNFVYNTTDGLLTLNFSMTSQSLNSTGNPLTISGKFSGTVYMTVD